MTRTHRHSFITYHSRRLANRSTRYESQRHKGMAARHSFVSLWFITYHGVPNAVVGEPSTLSPSTDASDHGDQQQQNRCPDHESGKPSRKENRNVPLGHHQ